MDNGAEPGIESRSFAPAGLATLHLSLHGRVILNLIAGGSAPNHAPALQSVPVQCMVPCSSVRNNLAPSFWIITKTIWCG